MERQSTSINKVKFLSKFVESRGQFRLAAINANVGKSQVYTWLKNDKNFRKEYKELLSNIKSYHVNQRLKALQLDDAEAIQKQISLLKRKMNKLDG